MALSLLVLLVPIFVLLGVYRYLGGEGATVVDPAAAFEDARASHLFPVAEPSGLPSGWQVASAAFRREDTGAVLRVGYRTPGGGTAQLVETDAPADEMVTRELGAGAQARGAAAVAGGDWQAFATAKGEHALLLAEPGRSVLVVGRADDAELATLARSLR